jgi:hypothetical protein
MLDVLPWLLGGAAVIGTGVVVYKATMKPGLTPGQQWAKNLLGPLYKGPAA